MSFWGATVITNLLSAIPVFGHDLVELEIYKKLIEFIVIKIITIIYIQRRW